MEFDIRKILLGHHQHIVGIGQVDIASFLVDRHILRFSLLEVLQHGSVVTFNPTGFIQTDRFPAALCSVFVVPSGIVLRIRVTDDIGLPRIAAVLLYR